MDYSTLTKNKLFKLIGGEAEINPNKAYKESCRSLNSANRRNNTNA